MDERVRDALTARETGDAVADAFSFGLACGSASCLRQENSVFLVEDALRLFGGMDVRGPFS